MKEQLLDPVAELFDAAAALRFLESALTCPEALTRAEAPGGAGYVTGLVGQRVEAIASQLADAPHRRRRRRSPPPVDTFI